MENGLSYIPLRLSKVTILIFVEVWQIPRIFGSFYITIDSNSFQVLQNLPN